jgi:CHAD domain-containing protein
MSAASHPPDLAGVRAAELLDTFERQLSRTLKSPGSKQVHDLRVASRRFAQALVIFESSFHGVNAIRQQLKTVLNRLGDVRDLDIALKFLHNAEAPDGQKIVDKIIQKLASEREKRQNRLQNVLHRLVSRHAVAKWRAKLEHAKIRAEASPAILEVANRFFDRGEAAYASDDSAKRLHRLRIATKKLRYTLELEAHRNGADSGKHGGTQAPIERLQSDLGHIHDFDSNAELLNAYRGAKKLLEPAEKKQQKRIREFRELWKEEFAGKKNRERWMQRIAAFAGTLLGVKPARG